MRWTALPLLSLCLATADLCAQPAPIALQGTTPAAEALQAQALGFSPKAVSGGPFEFGSGKALVVDTATPATVTVHARATHLRVLHTLVPGQPVADWKAAQQAAREKGDRFPDRLTVLQYVVHYADGRDVPLSVRYGEGIGACLRDWWEPVDGFIYDLAFAPVAWQAKLATDSLQSAVVYALDWPNPRPDVAIESVTLQAAAGLGEGRDLVYAVTVDDTPTTGSTYFIAPDGDDTAPGSFDRPWATLQKAADTIRAGDTVYVRGGTYRPKARIAFVDLKAPEGERTSVIGYPGETAVFDFMGALWDTSPTRQRLGFEVYPHDQSMIHAFRCEHFTLKDLNLIQSRARGFGSEQGTDNEIAYNTVYRTFGPGIRFANQVGSRCIGNTVVRACSLTMGPDGKGGVNGMGGASDYVDRSGRNDRQPPMEALDSGGLTDTAIAYNEICWADKESMLIDGDTNHLRIHHNFVHDGWNFPWVTGISPNGYGAQQNIEIDHNIAHHLGFGFGIGTEGGGYGRHVLIHHNIAWDCHWAGVGVTGAWRAEASLHDIAVYNNTLFHNGYVDWNTGPAGGIPVAFPSGRARGRRGAAPPTPSVVQDVLIANNLILEPRDYVQVLQYTGDPAASHIEFTHNLTEAWVDSDRVRQTWRAWRGDDLIIADPKLMDPQARDFRPSPDSPAIGAGVAIVDGKIDPNGKPVTIGAFPFDER